MFRKTVLDRWREMRTRVPELGDRHMLCDWFQEESAPLIDMHRYTQLLQIVPDKVAENLEKARLARDGRIPMLKAGLGYEELLSSVIVDGTAITSSSTEAFLYPALLFPKNYLQPGGLPGRTIEWKARGRGTTLTTGATMTFKVGSALTNVIPTTTWCVSGAITAHATAQTATQWDCKGEAVVRSVGSAGTIFSQGEADVAWQDLTTASAQNCFMGSAGSATPAAVTVDLTADQYVSLTGKWSLTTAYSITGHIFVMEALN